MSFDSNRAGRLDLLAYGACEIFVRRFLQPHMAINLDLWDDLGLNRVAARGIAGLGVPQGQIEAIRLGQLQIPMRLVENVGRAFLSAGQPRRVNSSRTREVRRAGR
jgi:hypothetical protein